MSTYLSTGLVDQLDAAQTVVDQHLAGCATCRTDKPCYDRLEAERLFLRYGKLPRRTPGLTGAGARTRTGFGWFQGP
jgi:hypothetical protein